jgi:hypothetical protein
MNSFTNQPKMQPLWSVVKGWSNRGGIYQIKCTQTGKTYFGSAGNIIKRLKQHYEKLTKNTHPNQEMQADFNLWGEKSFLVGFIKLVPSHYDRKQLYLDEQDYLDVAKSFKPQYYNKSHKCKSGPKKPVVSTAVRSFIRQHVDPYHCSRLTSDTFEVNGQTQTVISYRFQDEITHYHTIQH